MKLTLVDLRKVELGIPKDRLMLRTSVGLLLVRKRRDRALIIRPRTLVVERHETIPLEVRMRCGISSWRPPLDQSMPRQGTTPIGLCVCWGVTGLRFAFTFAVPRATEGPFDLSVLCSPIESCVSLCRELRQARRTRLVVFNSRPCAVAVALLLEKT